jgi:hypothetical protein
MYDHMNNSVYNFLYVTHPLFLVCLAWTVGGWMSPDYSHPMPWQSERRHL